MAAVALLLSVLVSAVGVIAYRAHRPAAQEQPVLAVLPFENLGPPADAYFADGLTDEVRSRLAGIGGLRVIGGTSARQYKGTTKPARQIARELGATHLLRATVRWERAPNGGGRVRVSPELERAADQSTVWAQPVEGPYDDVFTTQARVAEQVAAALDVALLAHERRAVAVRPTTNLAAYDAYLRGRAREADPDWTDASARRATIAEYQRAVALDPQFAAAHARLALLYLQERFYSPDTGLVTRARASATRAMALDSTVVDARLVRALVVEAEGDAAGAYRMLQALARDAPGDAMVYFRMGWTQQLLGHPEWAISSFERAALLEPRWSRVPGQLAGAYDRLSRYQEAIRTREREIALASDFAFVRYFQASSYLVWRADTAAARQELERGDQRQLLPVLTRGLGGPVGRAIWWRVMPPAVLAAKDTLTLAGFLRGGADAPELFHLMKAQHFAFTGRTNLARAHADSVIALAEPARRRESGAGASTQFVLWPHSLTLPLLLAEAYAYTGRPADAARAVDQYVEEARRNPDSNSPDHLSMPLLMAAYVDARIGRRDLAAARLTEALRLPSGNLISRPLLRDDPSWAPLRGHPGFERLIAGT
jgi:TolB-like protein/tetratricopeptide (TPR) repeat protein